MSKTRGKQVTRCAGCRKILRTNKSYTVTLTEKPIINGMEMAEVVRPKVKICKDCYIEAGYSPRGKGKESYSRDDLAKAYFTGCHDGEVKSGWEDRIFAMNRKKKK